MIHPSEFTSAWISGKRVSTWGRFGSYLSFKILFYFGFVAEINH